MHEKIYKAMIKSPDNYWCVRTMLADGTPITLEIFKTYDAARAFFNKLHYPRAEERTLEAFREISLAS